MDLLRLGEERSLAYHSAIAARMLREPEVLEAALFRVAGWLEAEGPPPFYAQRWAEVLACDVASVAAFLTERSELATELRHASPFAGALSPQERWRIHREVRERLAEAP